MRDRESFESANFESESGFDTESPPYILSTDFPFLVWPRFDWQGKKVLLIADSGDNIFTLWPLGVSQIVAVDIARKACFLNELKLAVLRKLSFSEFRKLFAPVYENRLIPRTTPAEKRSLYLKIRDLISSQCRTWLDSEIGVTDFPSPPWRELMFTHLIPHFNSEHAFNVAKDALKPYTLINLPIETALENSDDQYDVIYLSNIPEYIKHSLLMEERDSEISPVLEKLYALSMTRLKQAGSLMLYIFGDAVSQPDLCAHEVEIGEKLGLSLYREKITFSTPLIEGSFFTHTLIVMTKEKGK
ncbi:MAG: hypothetical protein DRG59_06235 [Deltaproteobacteria bacterium]|nr:MAG: hypothetical protein DRG59_06235 [Deltaproteobacteria bacterium]